MQKNIQKFVLLSLLLAGIVGCSAPPEEELEVEKGLYAQNFSFIEEDDGITEIQVPVKIERNGSGEVSVKYNIVASNIGFSPFLASVGEADSNERVDVVITEGTLVFNATTADTLNIPISIINDTVYEGNEQFLVILSTAVGANIIESTGVVSIENNDPAPSALIGLLDVNASTSLAEESEVKISMKISLDRISEVDAVVGVSRSDEDSTGATVGEIAAYRIDYLLLDDNIALQTARATLTIPAGEMEKIFEFQLVDDGLSEKTEFVTFDLTADSDVSTDSDNALTFTIIDDDTLPEGTIAKIPLNDTGAQGAFGGDIVDPAVDIIGYEALTAEEKEVAVSDVRDQFESKMDHSYGLDSVVADQNGFDFTKLNQNGDPTIEGVAIIDGVRTVPWDCVKDNVTGLVWEVKTNSNEGLRAASRDVYWYDPDESTNGGVAGTIGSYQCAATPLSSCNTSFYIADMNAAQLCGVSGWRLPTIDELRSLVDYSKSKAAIDENYFAGDTLRVSQTWSSTTYALDPKMVWVMHFGDLIEGLTEKDKFVQHSVRLVSDSQVDTCSVVLGEC